VSIPSNGPDLPIPARARISTIPAGERYGLVWVCVGSGGGSVGIPTLAEADDPGYTVIHELMEVWQASAPRIIDNALDVSHVSWVHRGTVGTPDHARVSEFEVERVGTTLRYAANHVSRVSEQQKRNTGITSDLTPRTTHVELVNPLVFRGAIEYPDNGLVHVLLKTATPIDDETTLFCQFVARNDAPDLEKQAGIIAVDRAVQSEDRAILERVRPDFPLDVTAEVHVRADRMTVEYRRILAELARLGEGAVADSAASLERVSS
jgi:phenylpropionate dioxygenase-like ring-hydroxylating dioxygenase large terminal subunit